MAVQVYRYCNMNSGHCQLGRSLDRILEEAHLSGELKLSNRKLKDFPKSATKYDLSDTVFADLSRNRFSELPEEITSFSFLETLILYHNAIRTITETVKGLSSLTYLDLRSNQLSSLPREICFLPIRVLLISNNRLTSLPEELGRMEKLTELDASCNLLSNLPPRMGDLKSLKSLSLRNNQLVYLPREITTLSLISLNLSSNRISSLPVEIRLMTTLVDLNLENNPLTSPPAGLCVRGLVHVFKYLELQATKDDNKLKACGSYDGYSTLRRTSRSANGTLENNKSRKNLVDPVCAINDGLDKLLSQENFNVPMKNNTASLPKSSIIMNVQANGIHLSLKNQKIQISNNEVGGNFNKSIEKSIEHQQHNVVSLESPSNNLSSTVIFDDGYLIDNKIEDKNKNLGNIQTYKEYKEALKQQRNQEIANLYKTKAHRNFVDEGDNVNSSNCNAIQQQQIFSEINDKSSFEGKYSGNNVGVNGQCYEEIAIANKKPVQKVIPSRNVTSSASFSPSTQQHNSLLNIHENNLESLKCDNNKDECFKYSKPKSPTKCNGVVSMNNSMNANNTTNTNIAKGTTNAKTQAFKSQYRSINWNQDMPSGKLSFTMRREFDKQKEETELLAQLRSIIETRLKMNVPEDIASALTDGVILCHLANHVRPRSVGSIHVPSPGVPKLTMARCRRNVDNFLEACRKIGVDEELICSCEDVVSSEETNSNNVCSSSSSLPNPSAVFKTISALLNIIEQQQQHHQKGNQLTPATNQLSPTTTRATTITTTKKNIMMTIMDEGNESDIDDDIPTTPIICKDMLEIIYENKDEKINNEIVSSYTCINVPQQSPIKLIKNETVTENNENNLINNFEGKILINNDNDNNEKNNSFNNCYHQEIENVNSFDIGKYLKYEEILNVNNLNITNNSKKYDDNIINSTTTTTENNDEDDVTKNINVNREMNAPHKIVTKRIEFFEGTHNTHKLMSNNNQNNSNMNCINKDKSVIFSICKPHSDTDNNNKNKFFSLSSSSSSSSSDMNQDSTLFTIFLSCIFLITFLLLIIFPISN